jgi:hypothetical protein
VKSYTIKALVRRCPNKLCPNKVRCSPKRLVINRTQQCFGDRRPHWDVGRLEQLWNNAAVEVEVQRLRICFAERILLRREGGRREGGRQGRREGGREGGRQGREARKEGGRGRYVCRYNT